jgi:hypothetical protein
VLQEVIDVALAERSFRLRPVRLWVALLDEGGAFAADPFPLWAGLTDTMEVVDGPEPRVSLTCGSRLVDLERAEVRRYTDADPQAEYPGDRFFEFVPALMDAKTLRKHFRPELDRGMVEANLKVGPSLFQLATSGRNVAAAIFWMKARAGWREKPEVEVSDKDGARLRQPSSSSGGSSIR